MKRSRSIMLAVVLSIGAALPVLSPARAAAIPAGVRTCQPGDIVHSLGYGAYSVEPAPGFNAATAAASLAACYGLPTDNPTFLAQWRYKTPILTPMPSTTAGQTIAWNTTNWGGWAVATSQNTCCLVSITDVSAHYNVPFMHGETFTQDESFWVGLGGDTLDNPQSTVIWQGGYYLHVAPSGVTGAWPFYENYGCTLSGCNPSFMQISNYQTPEGDGVYAHVWYSGGTQCAFTFLDTTTNQGNTVQVSPCDISHIDQSGEATTEADGESACGNQACGYPAFTAVNFNNVSVAHDFAAQGQWLCLYNDSRFNEVKNGVPQAATGVLKCNATGTSTDYGFSVNSTNP